MPHDLIRNIALALWIGTMCVALGSTFTWSLQSPPPGWYAPFLEHLADWFVAAFTGLLAFVTYRLVESTNRLWQAGERQLSIAKETAEAATVAAKVAEKTLATTNRPWLSVKANLSSSLDRDKRNNPRVKVSFNINNLGNSPAINIFVEAKIAVTTGDAIQLQKDIADDYGRFDRKHLGFTLFPNESRTVEIDMPIESEDIQEFHRRVDAEAGKKDAYGSMILAVLIGTVAYTFTFADGLQHTGFIYHLANGDGPTKRIFDLNKLPIPMNELSLEQDFLSIPPD